MHCYDVVVVYKRLNSVSAEAVLKKKKKHKSLHEGTTQRKKNKPRRDRSLIVSGERVTVSYVCY